MTSTVSLSKGVFAFKKSKSKKTNYGFSSSRFWRQEEGKNNPYIRDITLRNYCNSWLSVKNVVEKYLYETHSKILEDLINYLKRVGDSRCMSLLQSCSRANKDLPAACLVTGVNMPDHATIYNSLEKTIKEQVSPHVTRLTTADCSNIKTAVRKIIQGIVTHEGGLVESDSDEEILVQNKSPKKKPIKKSLCNMAVLSSWYKETELNQGEGSNVEDNLSPTKKQKTSNKKEFAVKKGAALSSKCPTKKSRVRQLGMPHYVIIIIEEVETVPTCVLQDLILISSKYQRSVPLLFIFAVSTTPAYIHQHLSQEASSSLVMETFQAQPSSLLLSEVIEKLLMNPDLHFRIGGKVFKLLLDTFLFHDLSVTNFISRLKFCMLEHFVRGEASFLCCSEEEREELLKDLPKDAVRSLKSLNSYAKLLDSISQQEKERLENDSYFITFVGTCLNELEDWYSTFSALVKVLHILSHSLPGSLLGKQVREVFSLCLSQQVSDSEAFQSTWKLLSMSAKEEFAPRVEDAVRILKEYETNDEIKKLTNKLSEYLEKMHCIDEDPVLNKNLKENKAKAPIELRPSDRFYLREKLLGVQKLKSRTPYEELRADILMCFENFFIKYLRPVQTKPFYEVFFFDSIGSVKYQILGSMRTTITTCLTDPYKYLQCKCCNQDTAESLLTTLPDLSLCYKLHLECGRLINLYDWMQAFIAITGAEKDQEISQKNKRKKVEVPEAVQARFIQAVSELQLLGFIKPTKKKTDHVQRLTWGC